MSGKRARWINVEDMIGYNGVPDEILVMADVPYPWMPPIKNSGCVETARAYARFCGLEPAWWAQTPSLFAKWLKGCGYDSK